jgi:acetyltransferase
MKAGRTMEGAKAAASHTGGLAKEDIATDLIFKKAGILSFRDEGELIQAAVAFATQPIPEGNRVGIITNTGGPAVIATDVMVGAGLTLPPLSDKTRTVLTETLFPEASVNNPVDVLATGPATHYRACLDAMMADENFDCVFVNFVTPFFVDNESTAKEIVEVSKQQKKPIVCNLMTDRSQWTEVVKILQDGGVPCFALPGEAARAMTALVNYHKIRTHQPGEITLFDNVDAAKGRKILEKAGETGKSSLSADEVYSILDAYNIPTAGWGMAATVEDAVAEAAKIGYPVVVKADAASILHKSDRGGVAVDLKDGDAVRAAVEKMKQRFSDSDLRFFVQQYLPGGLELIMGAKAEEGLGHAVMFGLGGIFVEVMKDVVFNLTPVASGEARQMLSDIQAASMLEGARGQKGVNQDRLIEIIQRLSQLLGDLPEIQEMDLNPLIAYEDQVFVVDARISIE